MSYEIQFQKLVKEKPDQLMKVYLSAIDSLPGEKNERQKMKERVERLLHEPPAVVIRFKEEITTDINFNAPSRFIS